jgi:RNA polymerase subunit RPABC4/transcription elongation factor Spt4
MITVDVKERNERKNNVNFDICHNCMALIEGDLFECPECGVIVKVPPRRKVEAKRDYLVTTESENMNGKYNIYILSDGSLFCDCRGFLLQNRVWVEKGQLICKHIQKIFDQISQNLKRKGQPLTEWQKVLLKKLNIEPHPSLTREQGYWVLRELLAKMGMEYGELINLLRKIPSIELFPLISYGLELEGLVKDREEFYQRLKELGFKVRLTGYSHDMENELWKVGDDGSVRRNMNDEERNNYQSVELTTPKLYAVDGLRKVKTVLDIWNEIGSAVNNSCGFHVHVDAWNFSRRELARLLLVWLKIEPVVYFLVSPSRRNNSYAKFWRKTSNYNVARMIFEKVGEYDRYYALNLFAFRRYRTVEFRLHQGTTNYEKVKNWTIFCLKLVEKVKGGLKWYHFSEEPTIEEVLDKLGIVENAVPIIRDARKFLVERYNHFRSGVQEHDLPSFDPESLSSMIIMLLDQIYSSTNLVSYVGNVSSTHYINLADYRPRVLYSYEYVLKAKQDDTFIFETEKRKFKVKFNEATGELSCNCLSFRQHQKCSHAISVARFIYVNEMYKDLVPYIYNLDF